MVKAKVDPEAENLALKAVEAMGLEYAGVDILETKRGFVVLEINGSPGWQNLKKATGIDIAKRIIEYACSKSRR